MRSGILFLFLFLVSILVISGCVELGPRKDIKNIMDTSLNLRSGGGSEGASAEISDCDDGIDNNNNGLVDQEDIMCSPRSRDRDFTSCEILFGGFSFSLIPSSAECRNSCEENSFSINSNEGYLQEDYDQNDGNGLSNLDLCGSYALKCCIGQDSQAYNLEAIDLCSLSEPDAWEGCIITEIQYCNTNDECFTGEGEVIIKFGCTNPLACNYDSDATDDNESCELPEENYDCDGNCLNDANSDGICDEYEYLYGCMDPIALNYNPVAEYDGGSCWHDDNIFWLTFNTCCGNGYSPGGPNYAACDISGNCDILNIEYTPGGQNDSEYASAHTISQFQDRIYGGHYHGQLVSCDIYSGECLDHGDIGEFDIDEVPGTGFHSSYVFNGHLYFSQWQGHLWRCEYGTGHITELCSYVGDFGSNIGAFVEWNDKLWFGEQGGELWACSSDNTIYSTSDCYKPFGDTNFGSIRDFAIWNEKLWAVNYAGGDFIAEIYSIDLNNNLNTYSGIEGSGTITGVENWGGKLWLSYYGDPYDDEDGGAPFLVSCDNIESIQDNNCLEHNTGNSVSGLVSYSAGGGAINRLYFFVESINNARILRYCNDYNDCSNSIEVYNPGKGMSALEFINFENLSLS